MERRTFLTLVSVAAGASLGAPRLFPLADDDGSDTNAPNMAHEFDVAQRLGKPLLVLVHPEPALDVAGSSEPLARVQREAAFGAWLSYSSVLSMPTLALCHVTSAPMAEARTALPKFVNEFDGEPWVLLIETGGLEPRVQRMEAIPRIAQKPRDVDDELHVRAKRGAEPEGRDGHAQSQLAAWLARALGPNRLEARARRAFASLTAEEQSRLESVFAAPEVEDHDLLWRAAAAAMFHASMLYAEKDTRAEAAVLVAMLRNASLRHLQVSPPRGTRWRPPRAHCPPCGGGHVPLSSRRFLDLLANG